MSKKKIPEIKLDDINEGDVVYRLIIAEKDELFSSFDYFVCKEITIERKIVHRDIYMEDDIVMRDKSYNRYKLLHYPDTVSLDYSDKFFKSKEHLQKHLLVNYNPIFENEGYLVLLDRDDLNRNIVIKKPQKFTSYSNDTVNLYDLITI